MKKHGSIDEKSWREYCFKEENRLPDETVMSLRKELTPRLGTGEKVVERTLRYGPQALIVLVTAKEKDNKLTLTTTVKWRFVAGKTEPKTRKVTLDITGKSVDEVLQRNLGSEISECMKKLGYYQ